MSSLSLFLALLVLGMAVLLHQFLFANVSTPPPDFGSGQMFDLIADRYDRINRVLALGMDMGWRKQMVDVVLESVKTKENPQLLDVATGTADVALLLADRIPTATVLGVDPSSNMLRVGREKIDAQNLSNRVTLQEHDARRGFDGVDDDTFDAATMSFGIRNIIEKQEALCQIHRVLKNESILTILEFSEPDESSGFLGKVARFFIRHVVPTLGGVLSGKPREYLHLQNSIKDFPTPPEFVKLIESSTCAGRNPSFKVEDMTQLSFGAVQLYVSRVLKSPDNEESSSSSSSPYIEG